MICYPSLPLVYIILRVNIFQSFSSARERHPKVNASALSVVPASLCPTPRPFFWAMWFTNQACTFDS